MMKGKYNNTILLDTVGEIVLIVPTLNPMFIRYCSVCDTFNPEDTTFRRWIDFLIEGTTLIKAIPSEPYLDIKHVKSKLLCTDCNDNNLTQVLFIWEQGDETTEE